MNQNDDKKIIEKLKNFRKEFLTKSDEEIFKAVHYLDLKYSGNELYGLNINGALINLGIDKKSLPLIFHSIRRLKFLHKNDPSDKYLFDIGNALFYIADIKFDESKNKPDKFKNKSVEALLINNKIYRQARKYFNRITSRTELPSAATNSGNILEKYGRYYEAVLLYDKALKINHNFGMALGNKANSLIFYYGIAVKKNADILFEALELLKSAIKADNTLEIGGQNAIDSFKFYSTSLEKYLSNKKRATQSSYIKPSPYQVFCSSKNIYMNFCFNCYKCKSGYKDIFFPPFIERINDSSDEERFRYHSFSKKMYYSVKTLNQILEDYTTSRSIYFEAHNNNFNELDADTEYISVLDYCKNSIKYGYLKTSYIKLYNILDKIAHLTFHNYKLEYKDVSFKKLLISPFKDLILSNNNYGLLALRDLAQDFEDDGIYNHLRIIRHYLTHDLLDIKIDMFLESNKQLELIENHYLTETLLMDYLDELFQIVKSALLYLGQALKKDYDMATENGKKPLLPFTIPRQTDIFEDIDRFSRIS